MKLFFTLLALTAGSAMAQNPVINEILNNYGLTNNGTVAQGAIFIVKGTNLADLPTDTLQQVPLQRNLRGVEMRITVNGVTTTAPLYYALNTQIAGILPSNTPVGNGTITVINNGKQSTPRPVTVVRSAFGMLTINGAGTGMAAVHDANYALLSNTNAARPGMSVVFYGSGIGAVANDETQFQVARDMTEIPIRVTIGGVDATVLYRGRTQFPGLDQINVTIPQLNSYSCAVAVVITTNGVTANPGTIPVTESGATCQEDIPGAGGGNSGIEITQDQVNRWISQGSYTTGAITTAQSTTYLVDLTTGATTIERGADFNAQFTRFSGADLARSLRGELPPGMVASIPQVGSCVVYSGTPPSTFPQITATSLDAGPQVTASGPNGTQVAPRLIQQGTITYSASNVPGTYFAAGRYTFTGTGGPGAGAFTGSLDIGTQFTVTNNPDEFKTINRNQPLAVRWTGGDPATIVAIQGISFANNVSTVFLCLANNSAGQFTVPASILSQLPASTSIGGGGLSFVLRGLLTVSSSNRGNRISIPNIDHGYAQHGWAWGYQPEFR